MTSSRPASPGTSWTNRLPFSRQLVHDVPGLAGLEAMHRKLSILVNLTTRDEDEQPK